MTALQAQLERLAERGPSADPVQVVRRATALASSAPRPMLVEPRSGELNRLQDTFAPDTEAEVVMHVPSDVQDRRRRQRLVGIAAAAMIAVAGGAGVAISRSRHDAPTGTAASVPVPAENIVDPAASIDPTTGSVLSTPLPADVRPLLTINQPGWVVTGWSGFEPMAPSLPSATCAGCGVTRLVVAADGPVFDGPIFTAWTLDAAYDVNEFDWPVTIGATEGGFIGSADGSTPAAQNQMRVVWPLGPGRTAFVEAFGFTNEQVFSMAASLTFESAVPEMASPPAGFSVHSAPPATGAPEEVYFKLENGRLNLEVMATNAGLQGLLDWQSLVGSPMRGTWTPTLVGGTPVALDHAAEPDEPPILGISASWVSGGWGFTVIGHVFGSETEFLDTVSEIHLTDKATFAAATANAEHVTMSHLTPSVDGTSGVVVVVDP